jgi:hypothetical protein
VQYHPEASPGPHDSRYLFQRFIEMMEKERENDVLAKAQSSQRTAEVS